VQFLPAPPERVQRSAAFEGLHALITAIALWL
jgi:hypothetical protein